MGEKGKIFFLLMITFFFNSCQLIKDPPVFEDLYEQEIKGIDWNEVDELPLLEPCKIFKSKGLKQECFFNIMNDSIYNKLLRKSSFYLFTKIDTVKLLVTISAESKISFVTKFPGYASEFEKRKVDSIIQTKLVNFPPIYPATKRGIPVASRFEIPVVLMPYKKRK
jgi:hypothetical protein